MPGAYRDLPLERTACSDIAWRRTEPWRRALAGLWPEIAKMGELKVTRPDRRGVVCSRAGCASRLDHDVELVHEESDKLESVSVDGEPCQLAA